MVIPKKHTDTLADLSEREALEYVKLISSYEANGYNVYARAPSSKTKSIVHQHTHLIKPDEKSIKFLMYIKTPHVRIVK
jgi:diadenosine tetraphosphate (Ap4A) HIT family hydrolase